MIKYFNIILLLVALISSNIFSQNNLPRLSPKAYVGQMVGYVNVEINYGTPGVKDRKIWGELVPYNKIWRTGANEATTIEFSKPILIEGNKIPAGKYSLFTIPGITEWTIILNKVADQWGTYKYNKEEDLIRFKVKPIKNEHQERLNFSIEYVDSYKANIIFKWEKIELIIGLDSKILK